MSLSFPSPFLPLPSGQSLSSKPSLLAPTLHSQSLLVKRHTKKTIPSGRSLTFKLEPKTKNKKISRVAEAQRSVQSVQNCPNVSKVSRSVQNCLKNCPINTKTKNLITQNKTTQSRYLTKNSSIEQFVTDPKVSSCVSLFEHCGDGRWCQGGSHPANLVITVFLVLVLVFVFSVFVFVL